MVIDENLDKDTLPLQKTGRGGTKVSYLAQII
jgi:hypothetical protein